MAYLRLPHASPVMVVLAACAATLLVLAPGTAPRRAALILLAMLGAQIVIGVVNELVDLPLDRQVKPGKPLAAGVVSVRGAVGALVSGGALMAAAGSSLGMVPLALCLLGCGIGVAYSVWFKRTMLAWLPYLIALPLLPIYVATATGTFRRELLLLYPLGLLAVPGVQIAQAVPDVAADRAAGMRTLTTRLGERGSMLACGLTTLASAGLLTLAGGGNRPVAVAAIFVLGAVLATGVLYALRPRHAVMAAFPVAAVSTAVLGIVWVYAIRT